MQTNRRHFFAVLGAVTPFGYFIRIAAMKTLAQRLWMTVICLPGLGAGYGLAEAADQIQDDPALQQRILDWLIQRL